MSVKKVIAAATLPAMMASPVVAATDNPAASLSLRGDSGESTAAETAQYSQPIPVPPAEPAQAGGIPSYVLIGGAVVALVIIGAVVLGSGHHNNHPASA
jgi:hypothetical protein